MMVSRVKRGEIYWVDWDPSRGSEQSGIRPALIIQNDTGNQFSPTTIIAALTSNITKMYPFTVNLSAEECGLPKDSKVNLAVLMTIDKTRLQAKCGEVNEMRMKEIDRAIIISLGLI